jgi:Flp pilus assembly protein TadD/peroxiredoxin
MLAFNVGAEIHEHLGMGHKKENNRKVSRRTFLATMRWAPLLYLPAPLHSAVFRSLSPETLEEQGPSFPLADFRLAPHYPAKSPLDDVLRYVPPGTDEFVTEKYAAEIAAHLEEWGRELRSSPMGVNVLTKFLDSSLQATSLIPTQEKTLRSTNGISAIRRKFSNEPLLSRDRFLQQVQAYLAPFTRVETAEFQIAGIEQISGSPLNVRIDIRYDFVGQLADTQREERIGYWSTEWRYADSAGWRVHRWTATEESLSRARQPIFLDVTQQALGQTDSYKNQLLHGMDYWRTVLDAAVGIDVYGNRGLAVGDFDNDGLDDLYICQPPGLPNRLYRNRGDGTFEDVTEAAGVGVLDGTACALFADFQNRGFQDLLVVCGSGPLLFVNQGNGKFSIKPDAFKFAQPPQGTFTHAAVADYDRDGRLDVYFGLYTYYLGLDQYHYPVPYFDARNGPPNFLFHNEGSGTFQDRTEAAGLNVENDRYTFACTWGDCNSDGWPDLYVVNDFGRNNLYRNKGDGTFVAVSSEAKVDEAGAGMSACWLDFDNNGNQDIYAAGMWVAAGMRVFGQSHFHDHEPENIRTLYRRHMMGNSLYRNMGNGQFQNVARPAGVEMGRWSWSTDAWDFDHDGYPDLYIANGYISGHNAPDVSSFFWRQVVAKSPANATPSESYERGWNAINESIRSDATWNGFERNVFYWNNQDGTFSDISGVAGLDFIDDSRSFALADIDHDGRLEIILKNRTAPQIRILHNSMKDIGASIAFRLQGTKSNRDAIGTAVTVEADGRRQTKYLQAGSGFLSQHTKELFFGLGNTESTVRASVRWPNGFTQVFDKLPANHRIELQEGVEQFQAKPFAASPPAYQHGSEPRKTEQLPLSVETWLIQPLHAPDFSLLDVAGNRQALQSRRGEYVLLHFWATAAPGCADQLRLLQKHQPEYASRNLQVLCVNLDDPQDSSAIRSFASKQGISLPILLATPQVAGVYNIIYRYLFDRRRDLPFPASLLLNRDGMIVKVYQGTIEPTRLLEDIRSVPDTSGGFLQKALPMKGTLFQDEFQRNDLTYGVAMFQRGYLEEAAAEFQQVILAKPDEPIAYYNLGTLYLRRNSLPDARRYLEQAVKLRPNYAEAWNNLGMIFAQQGQEDEAIKNFERSIEFRPTYVTALLNLGNLLRRKGNLADAQKLLQQALAASPNDPEANYSIGMLYARQSQLDRAAEYLTRAVALRPDYAEALNNLGILLVRQSHYSEAQQQFETCIQVAPNFDQAYLNLATLYVVLNDKERAREVLQALLRQQPQHKLAQQTLEMLN